MLIPKVKMVGMSSPHRGVTDKPNEDAYLLDEEGGIAVVADGVSLLRHRDGVYPEGVPRASAAFVRAVRDGIVEATAADPEAVMREAMRRANIAVAEVNHAAGIKERVIDCEEVDYLSTIGCALRVYQRGEERGAAVGAIGDSLALYIPRHGEAQLLTRDQLAPCHRYSRALFRELAQRQGLSSEEGTRRRIIWQRKETRNRKNAVDPQGNPIGFGVITGEAAALEFVDFRHLFPLTPGDQFLLASDAMRVLATPPQEGAEETAEHYQSAIEVVRNPPSKGVAATLIEHIRRVERHSDDATVVLVEIL